MGIHSERIKDNLKMFKKFYGRRRAHTGFQSPKAAGVEDHKFWLFEKYDDINRKKHMGKFL